jgi:hypothetical protein
MNNSEARVVGKGMAKKKGDNCRRVGYHSEADRENIAKQACAMTPYALPTCRSKSIDFSYDDVTPFHPDYFYHAES